MLKMRHIKISILVMTSLLMLSGTSLSAGNRAILQIGATIAPRFNAQAIQQIASYHVTREDIHRGYIDLSSALNIQVRTNIYDGRFLLQVANLGSNQVLIKELNNLSDKLTITPLAINRVEQKSFDLRVILPPETVAGSYPLSIAVQTTVL